MTLPRSSLIHPSLTYRLTGAMASAASQLASVRGAGFATLHNRNGDPILTLRCYPGPGRYGWNRFAFFNGSQELYLDSIPGHGPRSRFAFALGVAESRARVTHWS